MSIKIKNSITLCVFIVGFLFAGILPVLFVNQTLLFINPIFADFKIPIIFYLIIFGTNVTFGLREKINPEVFYPFYPFYFFVHFGLILIVECLILLNAIKI